MINMGINALESDMRSAAQEWLIVQEHKNAMQRNTATQTSIEKAAAPTKVHKFA